MADTAESEPLIGAHELETPYWARNQLEASKAGIWTVARGAPRTAGLLVDLAAEVAAQAPCTVTVVRPRTWPACCTASRITAGLSSQVGRDSRSTMTQRTRARITAILYIQKAIVIMSMAISMVAAIFEPVAMLTEAPWCNVFHH